MDDALSGGEQHRAPIESRSAADLPAAIGEVLDCLSYCFVLFGADGSYHYINQNHRKVLGELGADAAALLGTPAFSWDSAGSAAAIQQILRRVRFTHRVIEREIWIASLKRVYRQHFIPMRNGRVALVAHDISARKREKENADFMSGLQTAFLHAEDENSIVAAVVERVPQYFSLSRLAFAEVDAARDVVTTFHTFDLRPDADGPACYPMAAFLDRACLHDLYAGRLVTIGDTETDPRILAGREDCRRSATTALLVAPYCDGGGLRAILVAVDDAPRVWLKEECSFFMEIASRTYLNFVRAKAESDLRLSAARYRAMSEAHSRLNFRLSADLGMLLDISGIPMPRIVTPDVEWIEHAIHPDDRAGLHAALMEARAMEAPIGRELRIHCDDAAWADVFARIVPVRDAHGRVCEWFGAATDISARKRNEEALRASEARLNLALDTAHIGVFNWHCLSHTAQCDQRLRDLLGLPQDFPFTPAFLLRDSVHPQDAAQWRAAIDHALDARSGGKLVTEYRIRTPQGRELWVAVRGQVRFLRHGAERTSQDGASEDEAIELVGVMQDISARKRTEAELAVSAERLNLAIEGSGDGVIDYHGATGEHILSRRAWQILGYEDAPEIPHFQN